MLVKDIFTNFHGIPVSIYWYTGRKRTSFKVVLSAGGISVSVNENSSNKKVFAAMGKKHEWMVKAMEKVYSLPRPTISQYVEGEDFCFFGKRYTLHVEATAKTKEKAVCNDDNDTITLIVKPTSTPESRKHLFESVCKDQLSTVMDFYQRLLSKDLGSVNMPFSIQDMKSTWGTFNAEGRSITYNIALSQVNVLYVQYIVARELVHQYAYEPSKEFEDRMDTILPTWRELRDGLNKFCDAYITHD